MSRSILPLAALLLAASTSPPAYAQQEGEARARCMVTFESTLLMAGPCWKGYYASEYRSLSEDDKSFTLRPAPGPYEWSVLKVTASEGDWTVGLKLRWKGKVSDYTFGVKPHSPGCLFGDKNALKVCVWKWD